MREILIEEQKSIMFDILQDVHNFCKGNNILYYLCGGTLLGAVRHKGFIPWDDDIDIFMPRPDYMRFTELYNKNKDKKYGVSTIYNNPYHPQQFAAVYDKRTVIIHKNISYKGVHTLGILIDVFPIDGLPDDTKLANRHLNRQFLLSFFHALAIQKYPKGNTLKKTILKTLFMPFIKVYSLRRANMFNLKINENALKYDFTKSNYVAVAGTGYGKRERCPKSIFDEAIEVEFEGKLFNAPRGYHEYLTNIYQDYMTLPPLQKRKPHHNTIAYWKD